MKEDNPLRPQPDGRCQSKRRESDPSSPVFSFAAVASKEPKFSILPASRSPGQIPSDKHLVLTAGMGPAGQNRVTQESN